MIRVIINGVNGKMGQVLAKTISVNENIAVIAGIDKFASVHTNPFPVYENINECVLPADVLIDFSRPEALKNNLEYCKNKNISIVIATTGFNSEEMALVNDASKSIPIFMASNMSLGVNLQMELCKKAASFLGYSYDVEIIETHHNQKVDSPSGTALSIADSINEAYLNSMDYTYGRHSRNEKRTNHEIGIHSVRGGTVPGEHQVKFFGNDEILEINHFAISKQIFAMGAIRAAKFISEKAPGLYGMKDILAAQSELTNVFCDVDQAIISITDMPYKPKRVSDIFCAIAAENIFIDVITQMPPRDDKVDLSFTLKANDLNKAINIIEKQTNQKKENSQISTINNVSKITVEGEGMAKQSGVAAKVLGALTQNKISPLLIATSETKISICVKSEDTPLAINTISQMLDL